MRCNGFPPEQYDLYALGVPDAEDASDIDAHVRQRCATCIPEAQASLAVWTAYGSYEVMRAPAIVPPRMRDRVLVATGARRPAFTWKPAWLAAAAAIAVVFLAAALWYAARPPVQPAVVAQNDVAQISSLQGLIRERTQERDTLRQQLASQQQTEARSHAPKTPVAVQPVPSTAELVQLRSTLQDAMRERDSARDEATGQRASIAKLQQDLRQQQTLVESATHTAEDARARLLQAESNARNLAAQNQQLVSLRERAQQLELENVQLRRAIAQQPAQTDYRAHLLRVLSSPNVKLLPLRGTERAPNASGYALVAEGQRLVLFGSNLPALPPDRTYQLWLLKSRGEPVVSGGLFQAGAQQMAVVEIDAPALVSNLKGLAVTDEPVGGSKLPTGHKFLVGT